MRAYLLLSLLLLAAPAATATLELGGQPARSTQTLLAQSDTTEITLPSDQAYGAGPRQFRAVPLAPLARALGVTPDGALLTRAQDGFVAHIPGAIVLRETAGTPRAWLAIEPPDAPWPKLPRGQGSAGPFYVIWQDPDGSISTEYWAWQVVALAAAANPATRWPQLRVAEALPPDAPERRGEALFAATCLPCHRLSGAGEAEVGPDLNQPMNPTRYFQRAALARYIRDPASVRHWPGQRMPAFPQAALNDADIEAIIRYLEHIAAR